VCDFCADRSLEHNFYTNVFACGPDVRIKAIAPMPFAVAKAQMGSEVEVFMPQK
jgi:hypothetical protein